MRDQTPGDPFPSEPPLPDTNSSLGEEGMDFIKYGDEQLRVVKVLCGGMGEVYICEVVSMGNVLLALKTFQKRLFFRRAVRQAFEREVRMWMQLSGLPRILPAYDLIDHDHRPFVVMPAVVPPGATQGTTIRDLLNQGPLPRKQVFSFAFQMAYGLHAAQERIPGVMHGDLKPENLLTEFGQFCWIADFGLARVVAEADPHVELESTWAYRAPENWLTSAGASPSSDIYSFGAILYEMLTNKLPFQATAREEWSRLHREERPRPPKDFPQEGRDAALMVLALQCLQKNPTDRPEGFKSLLNELLRLAHDDDGLQEALGRVVLLDATLDAASRFAEVPSRAGRIESLLKNDDYRMALTDLEAMSQDSFDGRLWYLYGDALAQDGRDTEALSAFEKALQFDITEQERYQCYSLYGLSLKHLGRYQEAIDLYERLLARAPEEILGRLVINLATVYIESDRPEEALRYLVPFTHDHPEVAPGWVNLGSAYCSLECYAAGVRCYQRALTIAPERADVQVLLGSVLMNHFGRFEEAAACFQAAWDQGFESYEWLQHSLTCNLILDRKQIVAQLTTMVQHFFSEDELAKFYTGVQGLLEQITQTWRASTHDEGLQSVSDEGLTQGQADENDEPTQTVWQRKKLDFSSLGDDNILVLSQDQRSMSNTDSFSGDQNFPMPFLVPHFSFGGVCFIDFYYESTVPDYVDRCLYCLKAYTNNPSSRMPLDEPYRLSSCPFHFTRCPRCEIAILTNRQPGQSLKCRRCGTRHTVCSTKEHVLEALRDRVLEALGKKLVDLTGQVQVILIQSMNEEDQTKLIEDICLGAGFIPLPDAHLMAVALQDDFSKRGNLQMRPYSLWQKMSESGQQAYLGETPPEIEHVVRLLRFNGLQTNSLSSTYDPTDPHFGGWQAQTETAMIEEFLQRAQAVADQYQIDTLPRQISLLLWLGKMNEAKEKAQALTCQRSDEAISWILLGQTEMVSGHFQEATEALEKANAIDPINRTAMCYLAHCYQQLGDIPKAKMWGARWRSLGGSL